MHHRINGVCLSCKNIERILEVSFVGLAPLGLKSHIRQTFSHSLPGFVSSLSATNCSSSALKTRANVNALNIMLIELLLRYYTSGNLITCCFLSSFQVVHSALHTTLLTLSFLARSILPDPVVPSHPFLPTKLLSLPSIF